MPRNNSDRNSRGVVLVIVLVLFMALSGLTLMTIEVSSRGAVEASRMRSEYEAGFKAEEALYLIYDLLKDDTTPFSDTPREKWADKFIDEGLEIEIAPCNSKINLNEILGRASTKRTFDIFSNLIGAGLDTKTMIGSLGVWAGMKVDPKLEKIDNFYYASQNPAYTPRGAKLKIPEELLLVRGWEEVEKDWINETFTVWGSSKLNINFVSPEILAAYFPDLGKKVNSIMHWRRTRGFTDISQVLSVVGLDSSSTLYKTMMNELEVRSSTFEARVTASVGGCTVVKRYIISRPSSLEIGEPTLVYQNNISVTFAENQ